MPATSFPEYARQLQTVINTLLVAGDATLRDFEVDPRSLIHGYIAGVLEFSDGSTLHIREFVHLRLTPPTQMYVYHYQDATDQLRFRYDNAAHRPPLTHAEHKHTPSGIEHAPSPSLREVIDEVLTHIRTP